MLYTYGAELSEGIIVRTYLAKISGPDEQYRFKRSFLNWEYHRYQIQLWFTFEIDQGVYEQCIKYVDKQTGNIVRYDRSWFVFFDGEFYQIGRDEVLFCVFNLDLQSD